MKNKQDIFTKFASAVAKAMGHPWVFALALVVLLLWGASGPFLDFSDTWQLIVNTSTTIITFLMVFIIQNTQNRDNMAMNIKLDAILGKLGVGKQELLEAEEKSDTALEKERKKVVNKQEHTNGSPKKSKHKKSSKRKK